MTRISIERDRLTDGSEAFNVVIADSGDRATIQTHHGEEGARKLVDDLLDVFREHGLDVTEGKELLRDAGWRMGS